MDLRQLEYFVAVAEERHFARAASRLHVAQPSVSQQIKALEQELGVALLERTSRAVSLTRIGAEILPLATQLLADARRLRQHADLSSRRLAGRIRIGFLADEYSHPAAERFIDAARQRHPAVTFEFHQVGFAEQYAALDDAQVDIAFVAGPVPGRYASVHLFEFTRLIAVPRTAVDAEVTEADDSVANAAIVLPNQIADEAWRVAWVPPRTTPREIFMVGQASMEAMLSAVGAGLGVCVVPEYVARYYPQPAVRFLRARNLVPGEMAIAALSTRLNEPVIAALLTNHAMSETDGPAGPERRASARRGLGRRL